MRGNNISLFFHYANWKFPQMGSHEHVICIWKVSAFHDDSKLVFIQVLYKTLVPTSQEIQFISILRVNQGSRVLHKTVDIYCENQTKHLGAQFSMF
jgi:hypothetical protein